MSISVLILFQCPLSNGPPQKVHKVETLAFRLVQAVSSIVLQFEVCYQRDLSEFLHEYTQALHKFSAKNECPKILLGWNMFRRLQTSIQWLKAQIKILTPKAVGSNIILAIHLSYDTHLYGNLYFYFIEARTPIFLRA